MPSSLEEFYDYYPRIEEAFQAALDESLHPRGPDVAYEIVARLGLPAGTSVLDLGCGEGRQAIQLAERFRFAVVGVDPVARHIELATEAARQKPGLAGLVRFELGTAEAIPAADASVDLLWCREMLYHVAIDRAFAECRRVLRPGGRMLIYQIFATGRLESREAERLWASAGVIPGNADVQTIEAAFTSAGFEIDQCMVLASEGGEFAQEHTGEPGRRLIHAARLLRDPARYIAQFGQAAYDTMLGDCLWHVYRMIGKLSTRVYLLRSDAQH